MNESKDKESKRMTFWQLINDWYITIPQLQREYAQGRKDEVAAQIREGLLKDMRKSLEQNDDEMILNFVYGKTDREEKLFIPVDGQQRLTTLFLVHYFIFNKCKDYEKLKKLSKFSYKTRDTSRRFCEKLCEFYDIDFAKKMENDDEGVISSQIMNQSWFTGNMKKDPTVDSMLRMLDEIHRYFNDADVENMCVKLTSDSEMPVSFLWLEMEEFQKSDDLYIKMNARGKILSDFEIFKAKLQGSKILEQIVKIDGMSDEELQAAKIVFISAFNNQFIELFYSYFKMYGLKDEHGNVVKLIKQSEYEKLSNEDQKNWSLQSQLSIESADRAMMDMIQDFVRNDYFVKLCKSGKNSRTYRNNYLDIVEMKSGSFFRFIEKGKLEGLEEDLDQDDYVTISNSIKKISNILNMLSQKNETDGNINITVNSSKSYYSEVDILQTKIPFKTTLKDDLIAFSILGYLDKYGIPQTIEQNEAYLFWKRIVYNLAEHANLRANDNAVFSMRYIEDILEAISIGKRDSIIDALLSSDIKNGGAALQYILPEEICKAKLMKSEKKWFDIILEAEEYFEDGSIGFLLRGSSTTSDYENIDYDRFCKEFAMLKRLFTPDKHKQSDIGNELERALLCMTDTKVNGVCSAHLKPGSDSYSWCFYGNDFKEYLQNDKDDLQQKQVLLNQLIDLLIAEDEKLSQNGSSDNNSVVLLSNIINSNKNAVISLSGSEWKQYFINDNSLFSINEENFKFKNTVAFVDDEILLLTTSTVRGYSMELYTYLMYKYATSKGKKELSLCTMTTSDLYDNLTKFPCRYFNIGSCKIGYYAGDYYIEDSNGINKKTETEIKQIIDNL